MEGTYETDQIDQGPPEEQHHIPLAAEILGYVGGALALGAVVALLTVYWTQLGFYGREAVALGVALAGLLGGWAMARSKAPAAGRLSQFLLSVGVIGAGAAVAFDVYEMIRRMNPALITAKGEMFGSVATDWAVFSGLATLAVLGGAVWWRRRTVLQHLAFGLGVGLGTVVLLPLLPFEGPAWGAGAVLALVGLVWGALGLRGWLPPEPAALSLSALGILGGIEMMNYAISPDTGRTLWVFWLGLAVSAAMVAGAIVGKKVVILGFGAVGIVLFAYQIIDAMFRGTIGAPIALLVAGLLFVGGAVLVAMKAPQFAPTKTPVAEPAVTPVAVAGETAIASAEAAPEVAEPAPIPLVAEILGYVGGAFAVGAALALMTTFWAPLGIYGRLAVALVGALLGIGGGLVIGRQGSKAAHRLEQFMLAIGAIAAGFAAGIAVYEVAFARFGPMTENSVFDYASTWGFVAGSTVAALTAFALWWRRRSGLLLIVVCLALIVGSTNAMSMLVAGRQIWWAEGLSMLVLGVLFGIGALTGFLKPLNVSYSFASIGILMGLESAAQGPEITLVWVMWLGLAVSAGMIVASIPLKRGVLLGFGAAGVVLYAVQLVNETFGNRIGGPIMLLVIGVLFVAMAVLVAVLLPRMRNRPERSDHAEPPPISPHLGAHA